MRRIRRDLLIAEGSLVAVAAVWGLTFVMVKDAVEEVPVATFLAYRFLPAAAIVAVFVSGQLRRLSREGWMAGCVMGIFLTGGYAFQTAGLQYTTASKAGFITGLFVVLTPLFHAAARDGERAPLSVWAAAAIATAGLWLMSGSDGPVNRGDVLVFFCACSFALHILATNRGVAEHAAGALVVVQLGVCGLASLGYAAARSELSVDLNAQALQALAVTAVVASAAGFFVQTYAQQRVPPARTALVLASEPAFAGLFGYLLAGDRFGLRSWSGAALIVGAIVWVSLTVQREPAPA